MRLRVSSTAASSFFVNFRYLTSAGFPQVFFSACPPVTRTAGASWMERLMCAGGVWGGVSFLGRLGAVFFDADTGLAASGFGAVFFFSALSGADLGRDLAAGAFLAGAFFAGVFLTGVLAEDLDLSVAFGEPEDLAGFLAAVFSGVAFFGAFATDFEVLVLPPFADALADEVPLPFVAGDFNLDGAFEALDFEGAAAFFVVLDAEGFALDPEFTEPDFAPGDLTDAVLEAERGAGVFFLVAMMSSALCEGGQQTGNKIPGYRKDGRLSRKTGIMKAYAFRADLLFVRSTDDQIQNRLRLPCFRNVT